MKKALKSFLMMILSLAMVLNSCGVVLANTESAKATVKITEAVVDANKGIYKLVFSGKTTTSGEEVGATSVSFSYDNTIIQPVSRKSGNADVFVTQTTSDGSKDPFKAYTDVENEYIFTLQKTSWIVDGERTAVKADTSFPDKMPCTGEFPFTEFYFRVKDGKSANSETFKLETDYTDGSFLKGFYGDITEAAPIYFGDYRYGKADGTADTLNVAEFTYTGSNVKPPVVVSSIDATTSTNALKIPAIGGESVFANLYATVLDNKGSEVAIEDLAEAKWVITGVPEGVTSMGDGFGHKIIVNAGAKAGTIKAKFVANGVESKELTITVSKAASVVTKLSISGPNSVVKPSSGSDKATYTATVSDQYGEPMTGQTIEWSLSAAVDGVTQSNGVVTFTDAVTAKSFSIVACVSGTKVADTKTVDILELEVNWDAVSTSTIVAYDNIADGVKIDTSKAYATLGGAKLKGNFIVEDGAKAKFGDNPVNVSFEITEEGEYRGVVIGPKEYIVPAIQAEFEGTITAKDIEVVYTGDVASYDASNVVIDGDAMVSGIEVDTAKPVNAGTYTATITFKSTDVNRKAPSPKTAKLTIKPAKVTGVKGDYSYNYTASKGLRTLNALKEAMNLPDEIHVSFGEGKSDVVSVKWADPTEEWNVKGGDYTFVGTAKDSNLDFSEIEIKATAKINSENVSFVDKPQTVAFVISKAEALKVVTWADIEGLPAGISVSANNVGNVKADIVWNKDVTAFLAEANKVTDTQDVTFTLAVDTDALFADTEYDYLTVVDSLECTITITNKKPATITYFMHNDAVYGDALSCGEPQWEADDKGTDKNATFVVTYKGAGDTEYEESTVAPKNAGTYKAIVNLISEEYSAPAYECGFAIMQKPIKVKVADGTTTYGEKYDITKATASLFESELEYDEEIEVLNLKYEFVFEGTLIAGTYEGAISAKADTKNYNVSVIPGNLIVEKKSIEDVKVTLSGEAKVGSRVYVTNQLSDYSVNCVWMCDGEPVNGNAQFYAFTLEDLGKEISVYLDATEGENHCGVTAAETITVEPYEIEGTISILADSEHIVAGTELEVDTAFIKMLSEFESSGITLSYQWSIDGKTVEGATSKTFTVPEDATGKVSVAVTAAGNGTGTITSEEYEINKKMLSGTITLVCDDEGASLLNVGNTITATIETEMPEDSYKLVWVVDGKDSTVEGDVYEVTKADHGKTITAKLVAVGDVYSGEIWSSRGFGVDFAAPSDVVISSTTTTTSITVTLTANGNGAAIDYFFIRIGEEPGVRVYANEKGEFKHTFDGLEESVEYTVYAVANSSVGSSVEASATITTKNPYSGGGGGGYVKPTQKPTEAPTEEPETPENVVVETEESNATVSEKELAGKETATVTVTTNDGTKVTFDVDVKDADIDKLEVSATESDAEVAEGMNAPIEVEVLASKDGEAVDVAVNVTISAEEKVYGYAVDELGNVTRVETSYDEDAKTVTFENVASGDVIATSSEAPAEFVDTIGRWSEAEINKAADRGLVSGRDGGKYDPVSNLTRSESNKLQQNFIFTIKHTLSEKDGVKIDTLPAHWAYESDVWAVMVGITEGVGTREDGTIMLAGDANITRQDFATQVARILKMVVGDIEVADAIEFVDGADINDYARDAISLLSSIGILNGTESADGIKFNPRAEITREEAAAIINRMYEYILTN